MTPENSIHGPMLAISSSVAIVRSRFTSTRARLRRGEGRGSCRETRLLWRSKRAVGPPRASPPAFIMDGRRGTGDRRPPGRDVARATRSLTPSMFSFRSHGPDPPPARLRYVVVRFACRDCPRNRAVSARHPGGKIRHRRVDCRRCGGDLRGLRPKQRKASRTSMPGISAGSR